jgi:DNA-directed RNA polymerase I, II, and III subunit RPABC3
MSSSSSSSSGVDLTNLHTDTYIVQEVNPGGKRFDKVNRIVCKGNDAQADVILDIACEVYNLSRGDKFKLCLSGTLRIDGKPDEDTYNQDGKVGSGGGEPMAKGGGEVTPKRPSHPHSLCHTQHTTHAPLFCGQQQPTLLDSYEYGMCGKIFRHDSLEGNLVSVIASFGGLLMQIKGEMRHLMKLRMDSKVYALLKKVAK